MTFGPPSETVKSPALTIDKSVTPQTYVTVGETLSYSYVVTKTVKDKAEIQQVATVSANWDETIGAIIADAMDKVGKDGLLLTPRPWSNKLFQ